jgi:putative NADH-flavin reductase
MNITIFGANGAIGTIITNIALKNGDTVTAYVRRPESFKNPANNLNVALGDLSNQSQIEKAIAKSNVVISTLGPALDMSRKFKGNPIAEGHEKIIHAMERLGKKRFITLATPSIKSDDDRKQIATIIPGIMARFLFPNGYREMKLIEFLIKKSLLDWTVVRIINPNAKHSNKGYMASLGDKPAKMSVSRENVAAFIYDIAVNGSYIRQMPIIFNK